MGLFVSHGCWAGSYVAFNEFRKDLAEAAGVPLTLMDGWYEPLDENHREWMRPRSGGPWCNSPHGPLVLTYIERVERFLPLPWDDYEDDPVSVLLRVADTHGEIDVYDTPGLANRLDQLSVALERSGRNESAIRARQFARGLRLAHDVDEPVQLS